MLTCWQAPSILCSATGVRVQGERRIEGNRAPVTFDMTKANFELWSLADIVINIMIRQPE